MLGLPTKMKILLILARDSGKTEVKLSHSAVFRMKTTVSFEYFVNDCGNTNLAWKLPYELRNDLGLRILRN